MKYCTHCGSELYDDAVICVKCGRSVVPPQPQPAAPPKDDTIPTITKIFLILGCISQGWLLLPLAWCIPITVSVFRRYREGSPIGTGLKVCALLFVSMIAGILLLCAEEAAPTPSAPPVPPASPADPFDADEGGQPRA